MSIYQRSKKTVFFFILFIVAILTIPGIIFLAQHQSFLPSFASSNGEISATLADYWDGKASWQLRNKLTLTERTTWQPTYKDSKQQGLPVAGGTQVIVQDGIWYMFSRNVLSTKCSGINSNSPQIGTEVRKSLDKGRTWSDPVQTLIPQAKTEWSCAATDGSAFYDDDKKKWLYLYQCLGDAGAWNGCYAERSNKDPMGTFDAKGKVLQGGDLWKKICNSSSDACSQQAQSSPWKQVKDEGTFDIFAKNNNEYFVSFHGYDGTNGYRGIAKTKDFKTWTAGNTKDGVPSDAFLTKTDMDSWQEDWQGQPPIGFGAGNIVREGNYYYSLNEGANINLAATNGQRWDWGIFRSKSLTNSKWEGFPQGNPIYFSSDKKESDDSKTLGGNPGYGRLFIDPSTKTVYFEINRYSLDAHFMGTYIYQLVKNTNLLKNSDVWMCSTKNWLLRNSQTPLSVVRDPARTSDSNCALSIRCSDSTCTNDQSLYQDIPLTGSKPKKLEFGAKIASDNPGLAGSFVLFQFDAGNNVLDSTVLSATTTKDFTQVSRTVDVKPTTTLLRYQFYPQSDQPYLLDEMRVTPTE